MRSSLVFSFLFGVVCPAFAVGAESEELFANRVWPLLQARCLACHGKGEVVKGGFDLRTSESARRGGESGEHGILPGRPDLSPLYLAAQREDDSWSPMPPKENDKLTPEQLAWIRKWIAAGAAWPDEAEREQLRQDPQDRWGSSEGVKVQTSGGLDRAWTERRYEQEALWSYRPIRKPDQAPATRDHPVDAFIEASLREANLVAAPPAGRRTLLRRVTFGLTGLPPTPSEMRAFLADPASDAAAFAHVIARLLNSPHYGERMAQHWLDVTRYADTSGFSNDYERPGVWRYRDYVVRSFNDDKPFDQFITEQIAGDLLDDADPEMSVAVGFLRMGPWEATAMSVPELTRQQFLDDVVNHVGQVFLAQPLRCAKCHDHKFDPIPTRDYYRVMAAFGTTQPAELPAAFAEFEVQPDAHGGDLRVRKGLEEIAAEMDVIGRKHFDAGLDWLTSRGVDTSEISFRTGGYFNTFNTYFGSVSPDKRPPRNLGLTDGEVTQLAVLLKRRDYLKRVRGRFDPVAFTVYSGVPNGYKSTRARNGLPPADGTKTNPPIHILSGGAVESPLEVVQPGVLSCIEEIASWPAEFRDDEEPRLTVARWIANERNPLTARVMVNRIWQQHFGTGLVATPNNFGKTGARPTHPGLLDYLANWLIENEWSLKKLHRLILASDTYLRSARHPDHDTVAKLDPEGKLLAAFPVRRLDAEQVRDAMLVVSGELNPEVGGPPVFPEINLEAALQPRYVMSGVAPAYQPSPLPRDRHRRTLYAFRMRGLADPLLEVFNRPSPDLSCERRDTTTVATQAFALLNGRRSNARALALAKRLESSTDDPEAQIELAYDLVFCRPVEPREKRRALAYLAKLTALHRDGGVSPAPLPTTVKRSMVGEMTGALYEWEEPLDVYSGPFVPDLQPWDVGPETRALASLCLVLFNANEFLYIE